MAKKRRSYKKKGTKLKLKKGTVYTIFALGTLVAAAVTFLSFINTEGVLGQINTSLHEKFGGSSILFPFLLVFFAFFLFHMKMFLSRLNVILGYVLFFFAFIGLTKSGSVGTGFFQILSDILTKTGAELVYIAGVFVGIIVFFDTSVDEIMQTIALIGKNVHRLFPTKLFSRGEKTGLDKKKPITIKGIQNQPTADKAMTSTQPVINKKEPEQLPEKMVSNMINTQSGIWEYPPLSLLQEGPGAKADRGDVNKIAGTIEKTLQSFGVDARVVEINLGPAVTQYALEIALGTKVSKITTLTNDLALATEAPGGQIRIEAPIPGRNLVGIEIPNKSLEVVTLRTMLGSSVMQKNKSKLVVSMGLDVSGSPIVADIAKMPHTLVAGTTGSGKSVLINSFIASLLFRASPAEVRLILIDPKRVEFTSYNGIPHLLVPVIVEVEQILSSLKWAVKEMEDRYRLFGQHNVRNIDGYNELSGFQALPYIVIVIDELADLMMYAPVEVEDHIARIAQKARAAGIHLVIATQRPSVNVITGLIKANIPCRIAFNVSSMIDSRVILDTPGAEKLLGRGDMLYIPPEQAKPTRIQGAYVSEKEVKKLVDFLKSKNLPVEYTEEVLQQPVGKKANGVAGNGGNGSDRDPMFDDVVRLVCQFDTASASFLQRKMSIGYSRAARILDQLEELGVVGHAEGSKPRDVLVRNADEFLAQINAA